MSCLFPFYLKKNDAVVPCGKCPECLKRRVSDWSFRLMKEYAVSSSADFITLTYATKHVPVSSRGRLSLEKRDLQLFFKRLRKSHGRSVIRYYAVGEYGGKRFRPHYHVILFNADKELVADAWGLGNVYYGTVTSLSVGYVLGYISKPKVVPLNSYDDRAKEFSVMSKGIGKNYLTPSMVKWHRADIVNRMYVCDHDEKRPLPRYYKKKMFSDVECRMIAEHAAEKMGKDAVVRYEQGIEAWRAREQGIKAACNLFFAKQKGQRCRSTTIF